jgi:hypothetical protein
MNATQTNATTTTTRFFEKETVIVADVDAFRSAARAACDSAAMTDAEYDRLLHAVENKRAFRVGAVIGNFYGCTLDGKLAGMWFPAAWLRKA